MKEREATGGGEGASALRSSVCCWICCRKRLGNWSGRCARKGRRGQEERVGLVVTVGVEFDRKRLQVCGTPMTDFADLATSRAKRKKEARKESLGVL
jgi:hypothetical protein